MLPIILGIGLVLLLDGCSGNDKDNQEPVSDGGSDGGKDQPPQCGENSDRYVREGETLSFPFQAQDAHSDRLTFSSSALPSGASLDPSGLFRWQPGFDQAGSYGVPFNVTDGSQTTSCVATIQVENVNRAPQFDPLTSQSVQEGQLLSFVVTATDPDNQATLLSSGILPRGARFMAATGTFEWTPDFDQSGDYSIDFQANDGETSATQSVAIAVENVNHAPPVLAPIGDKSIDEGSTLTFTISAMDADGDPVRYEAEGLPSGATLDPTTGFFRWAPTYRQAGTYTVTFRATDGTFEDSETILIGVNNVLTDLDGDGFREDRDCNDDNASVRPLEEYETTSVLESLTICPGVYRGANILVEADEISLSGEGVTLDGTGGISDRAILAVDHHSIDIFGFTIHSYAFDIYLDNVRGSTIAVTSIREEFRMDNSDDNDISGDEIGGIVLTESDNNILHDMTVGGVRLGTLDIRDTNNNILERLLVDGGAVVLFGGSGNSVLDSEFSGSADERIVLRPSSGAVIRGNTIRGGTAHGFLGGGALAIYSGDDNLVEDNLFEGNWNAINLLAGDANTVRGNIVRFNAGSFGGAVEIGGTNSLVEDNSVTDNDSLGMIAFANGNVLRNNDLRRNTGGNRLSCDRNTCEGNTE